MRLVLHRAEADDALHLFDRLSEILRGCGNDDVVANREDLVNLVTFLSQLGRAFFGRSVSIEGQ